MLARPAAAALSLLAFACADLTEPRRSSEAPATPTPAPVATPAPVPGALRTAMPVQPAPPERITASHLLVAYKGAARSRATRSKEEAQKLAEQYRGQALKNQDFAELARAHSDDPTAKTAGGSLGQFDRGGMVKAFSDAAFALKPGEISAVVETEFGFHVIKRTQ